jgi:flavodoxin
MKALVVYYSRTGVTRKVAQKLSADLGADLEEIIDNRKRNGLFGFLRSGMEAYLERLTTIGQAHYDASQYDVVVIGTPVWSYRMSSPVRTYLVNDREKIKAVAFFVTLGGENPGKALTGLEELAGKKPIASVSLRSTEVGQDTGTEKIKDFLSKLQ